MGFLILSHIQSLYRFIYIICISVQHLLGTEYCILTDLCLGLKGRANKSRMQCLANEGLLMNLGAKRVLVGVNGTIKGA